MLRKKKRPQLKIHFTFHLPFFIQCHCFISYTSSPCCVAYSDGDWGWKTVNNISSLMVLHSHTFLCSSVQPVPQVIVLSSSVPSWGPFPPCSISDTGDHRVLHFTLLQPLHTDYYLYLSMVGGLSHVLRYVHWS